MVNRQGRGQKREALTYQLVLYLEFEEHDEGLRVHISMQSQPFYRQYGTVTSITLK